MLVGDFDSPEKVTVQTWGREHINTPHNKEVNLRSAHEAIVLLRNDHNVLPLPTDCGRIAIIGPNGNSTVVFTGDYEAIPDHTYTLLEAITIHQEYHQLPPPSFAPGCNDIHCTDSTAFEEAFRVASQADTLILAMGTNKDSSKEGGDLAPGKCDGDSTNVSHFPGCQVQLTEALLSMGKRVVVIGMSGQHLNFPEKAVTAIFAPFLGNYGGLALSHVLFGEYNPAGRLPFTVYKDTNSLPEIGDYDMTAYPGRTYRYHQLEPQFPFGYGLSYTSFSYSNLKISKHVIQPCEVVHVEVDVKNEGMSTY